MRVVLQRVSRARVTVDGRTTGEIGLGLMLLVGFTEGDGEEALVWVRETAVSSVLCVAARGFYDVVVEEGDVWLTGEPERLFGDGGASLFGESGLRLTGSGPSFAAWALPGVEVPRTDDEEELAQRALLDENASQDAALAHGEPAAPTLTAAWSKDTLEA